MNIYLARLNDLPTWLIEAKSLLDATATVINDIKNAPADSDFQELEEANELELYIHLVIEDTNLQKFEENHDHIYDAFF